MKEIRWILLRDIVKFFDVIDSAIDNQYLESELVSLSYRKPEGKILFYRYSEKWHGFFTVAYKEDQLILLKMILEARIYDECAIKYYKDQSAQSPIEFLFFFL